MAAFEKHYRVKELAALWGMSADTITRLFANEPGVLRVNNFGNGKRKDTLLCIPASVALRVHESLSHNTLQAPLPAANPLRIIRLSAERKSGKIIRLCDKDAA
jgi:hypothetical protein